MSPEYLMRFAGIALAVMGSSAFARGSNSLPPITVQASHAVTQKQVGMSYTGIPTKLV
jgi:hypothetical protein